MKRVCLAVATVILGTGLVPGIASAADIQIGTTPTALVAPVCPSGVAQKNCKIVLTQVTAVETLRDGTSYPTTIHQAGLIVSFSLGISALSTNAATATQDITYLNATYGGPAEAELAVLRPVGPRADFGWSLAAESPPVALLPYLGEVAEFPLLAPVPVVPGEVVGLTIPTWAPILTIDVPPSLFAYRQDRSTNCGDTPVGQAELQIGEQALYKCPYFGTRIEYSANEITAPTPTRAIRRASRR